MVMILLMWRQASPNLYNVQSTLSTHLQGDVMKEINARKRGVLLADHSGAFPANYGGLAPNGSPHAGLAFARSRGGGGRRDDRKYNLCKQVGHLKRDCPL